MKNNKKNILIVDPFIGMGGEEEVAFYIYKNLDRNLFNVKVMAPKDSRYFDKNSPEKEDLISSAVTGKFKIKEMIKVRKLIKEHNIDLIHVHGYSSGFFVRLACIGMKSIKIVWTMHLNILDVSSMNKFSRRLNATIENILSNNKIFTDRIICVAEDGKKSLINRGVKKVPINVIYNGIDTKIFKDNKNKNDDIFTIGFISRLSVQKNIPLLLEIGRTLIEKGLKIRLIIAGEGEMYEYANNFITDNHLEDHISLVGFQSDVYNLLNSIDILLLPSLYECFPMIILEALACGVPVVGSNVNGIPEAIINNETGLLVESNDLHGFIKAIEKYYYEKELIDIHGKNGQDLVRKKFSKEIMLKEHEKLYMEVLEQ